MGSSRTKFRGKLDPILFPFRLIAEREAAGELLLVSTVIALALANSPFQNLYHEIWQYPLSVNLGYFVFSEPLILWINDGLMSLFFFVIGLEIKRELLEGELSSPRNAMLPIIAAVGGMLVPAIIYIVLNIQHPEGFRGWGIPMATDIAFVLGTLKLLGKRVPISLKIFLTTLAIVDDIGAVLVIALFYGSHFEAIHLLTGAIVLSIMLGLNKMDVHNPYVYALFGIGGLWYCFFLSGIHPTIAGILGAFTIPARSRIPSEEFVAETDRIIEEFKEHHALAERRVFEKKRFIVMRQLRAVYEDASSPLERLEFALHPWVDYLVLPLFALANCGIILSAGTLSTLSNPIAIGIAFGLFFGKPIGILFFSWLAIHFNISTLPRETNWHQLVGASILGGIGFTMSLFISVLAFQDANLLNIAKTAVLFTSLIAGLTGCLIIWRASQKPLCETTGEHYAS